MPYLIVTLLGLALIWGIFAYFNNRKEKPAEAESETTAEEAGSGEETGSSEEAQPSLDSLYAESMGAWLCRRCETINEKGSSRCAACGALRQ